MNKRIKKIIAMTLTVCAFCAVSPVTSRSGIMMPQAVAASDEHYGITGLDLYKYDKSDDKKTSVDLFEKSRCYSSDKLDFSKSVKTYYTKTDGKTIKIDARAEDGYVIKIFKNDSTSAYDPNENISLSSGDNTIVIRTYESGSFDRENIKKGVEKTYKIYVKRTTDDDLSLKDIRIQYGKIAFSKDKKKYDVNVKDKEEIEITAVPENSDNKVRIDGNTTDSDNMATVELRSGKNEIDVDVEDSDGNVKTYVLNIYRGGGAPNDESDLIDTEQDKVYLEQLDITDTNDKKYDINFSKYITKYKFKVDSDIESLNISALPYVEDDYDDEDYKVRVNGTTITSEKNVKLEKNKKNTISVKVENKDNKKERTYTLEVTRGTVADSDNQNGDTDSGKDNKNKWVFNETTHTYQYFDENGTLVKNKWLQMDGKYYYADENGNRKSGWQQWNNQYYYMDENGVMLTGWVQVGPTRYYLNNGGDMAKGWIRPDGVTWYYMEESGAMHMGWVQNGAKWYYTGSTGAMLTGKQVIDGKSYTFNNDGLLL